MRRTRIRLLMVAVVALAVAALAPAVAGAAPAVSGVFDLGGTPHHLALGPDGNVWVALDGVTYDVARVRPDGTVTGYQTADITSPNGIVAGPDGNMWVTQSGGVVRFPTSDPTRTTLFPVADITDPRGIVVGPDGKLWTGSADQAVQIGTDGRARSFTVTGMSARGIVAGGDGNLYIADFGSQRVVGLTTAGVPTFYATGGGPQEVGAGPNGQIVVANPGNVPQQLGRFTPPGTTVQTTDVPSTDPFGIVFGDDGAYWIASFARDALLRMTPDGAVTMLAGFPRLSGPRYLTKGAGGTLWVGLEQSSQIARVTGVTAPASGGGGGGGGAGTGGSGGSGPPRRDTTPPALVHVSLAATLRLGHTGTLRLNLSETATVTVRFERRLSGRRKAGRCGPPSRAPHAKRCTRLVAAGGQRLVAHAGTDRLTIGGRIGRHLLPLGSYTVAIVATDAAGNASKPVTRRLQVVRPPRRAAARRP